MTDLERAPGLAGRPMLFVDAVEDAVDEAARFLRAEFLGDLDRLVDDDLRGGFAHPEELEDALPEDVPVDHRHPVELPVLGVLRDELVDLRLVQLGAADEPLGELARVRIDRMPRPELAEVRLGIALALHVELIQELERHLAGLPAPAHAYPLRDADRRPPRVWVARTNSAISMEASAASSPRLPTEPPARSQACSSVSAVMTPKLMGTPVASAAWVIPWAAAADTYSKCGVAPLMTTPTQTIAANRPVAASARAA